MNRAELVAHWKERRRRLRKAAFGTPEEKRILFARGDELRRCYRELEEAEPSVDAVVLLEDINAAAEADMLAGRPVTGAHHRAIEAALARLRAS